MTRTLVLICLVVSFVAIASPAKANAFLIPYVGTNFGGDSESGKLNAGVAIGFVDTFGLEFELGHTRDFFDTDDPEFNVTSMMVSLLVSPSYGAVQPYAAIGGGLLRVNRKSPTGVFSEIGENEFGFNVGGGVVGKLGPNLGLRGDIRYFRRTESDNGLGLGDFNFVRGSVGLVLGW